MHTHYINTNHHERPIHTIMHHPTHLYTHTYPQTSHTPVHTHPPTHTTQVETEVAARTSLEAQVQELQGANRKILAGVSQLHTTLLSNKDTQV